ncbi:lysozyme-like protein [Martensiomyces pterosporus]|nr:lysozyme-like protein [Martensiomyces pterosporus]
MSGIQSTYAASAGAACNITTDRVACASESSILICNQNKWEKLASCPTGTTCQGGVCSSGPASFPNSSSAPAVSSAPAIVHAATSTDASAVFSTPTDTESPTDNTLAPATTGAPIDASDAPASTDAAVTTDVANPASTVTDVSVDGSAPTNTASIDSDDTSASQDGKKPPKATTESSKDVPTSNAPTEAEPTLAPTTASPSPVPTGSPSTGGGATFGITCEKFNQAVVAGGKAVGSAYPVPSAAQCKAFLGGFKAGEISSAREAAMFLTNMAWESDGLRAKEEYLCKQTPSSCYSAYGAPNSKGQYFWGRGYTQLSWDFNYKAASQALYGDDRLYQNPEQVATNEDMAWGVSFWFWKANVHSDAGVQAGNFGSSVNKINGALECHGGANADRAKKRYQIYQAILKVFAPSETPKEAGCYN